MSATASLTTSITALRRQFAIYKAVAGTVPKQFLAYSLWVWVGMLSQIVRTTIFVFFWRAVYSDTTSLGGLNYAQTITYILLAQLLAPLLNGDVISDIGYLIRSGDIVIELVRPVDLQLGRYSKALAWSGVVFIFQLPLLTISLIFFGLQLPGDPLVWLCFAISMILGHGVLFCFNWLFAAVAFYSTEVWGLDNLQSAVNSFFGGELIPLVMMPGWLQTIAGFLPFAQGLYVPVGILSGTLALGNVPRLWLIQIVWLVGLAISSRLFFNFAVRKVTIQGG